MKIKRLVEVEVDGPELFKHLREEADIDTDRTSCAFQVGDIVDTSGCRKGDYEPPDHVTIAVVTGLDLGNPPELAVAWFDEDGDIDTDNFVFAEDVKLIDRLGEKGAEERPAPGGFGTYKSPW
jgi:hypothetical protein